MRKVTILTFLLVTLVSSSSMAFSFRCGREIVLVGDTTIEVLMKCGEPTLLEEVGSLLSEKVEKWYYNCGSHKFIQILTLRAGVVESIKIGDYGRGESDCTGAESRERERGQQ